MKIYLAAQKISLRVLCDVCGRSSGVAQDVEINIKAEDIENIFLEEFISNALEKKGWKYGLCPECAHGVNGYEEAAAQDADDFCSEVD